MKCTATDSLNRKGECTFNVTVSKLAQLSKTRYLAFGDSITAGEVTFPVGSLRRADLGKLVIVPRRPIRRTSSGRCWTYPSQSSISVLNAGLGGEKAVNARDRFF